jgi:hypothetical protein
MLNGPGSRPIRLLIVPIAITLPPGKLNPLEVMSIEMVTGKSNTEPVVTLSAVVVRSGGGAPGSGGPEALTRSEENTPPLQLRVSVPVPPSFVVQGPRPSPDAVAMIVAFAGWMRANPASTTVITANSFPLISNSSWWKRFFEIHL